MAQYQSIAYLKTLDKEQLKNKKVIVRVDFNVPLDNELQIRDDTRIKAAMETIKYLRSAGSRILLMSHLGRPKGKIVDEMRLNPVAIRLGELLQDKIMKLDDCIGSEVEASITKLKPGQIALLENLRFYPEEKKNDKQFAQKIASLCDVYVNDAFGAAHRAHASTAGIAEYLPAYAGFLMAKEIEVLGGLLEKPKRPFVSIIGGAKVSGKIEVLEKLVEICDTLLIGGGMAYTFLAAQGYQVGKSILESNYIDYVNRLMNEAKVKNKNIILPQDIVVTKEFNEDAESKTRLIDQFSEDDMGMDIGQRSIDLFSEKIKQAKTIFWNGPVGVFEMKKFAKGTISIAEKIADLEEDVFSVVGGGDSIAALKQFGLTENISHISTGGGASLEFLSGKTLPGLAVLEKQEYPFKQD